ncbi:MAG: dihydrofolate reductase [Nitrospirota bacterium]
MIISIIAAMDENRVIGRGNKLPWHLPVDLKRFRMLTLGHPIIMGRKTYESIGRPLDGRKNIVITRQSGYRAEGCIVVHDLPSAFEACGDVEEAFVLGGESLFRDVLPLADKVYLTVVRTRVEGDVRFPAIPDDLELVSRREAQDVFPLEFLLYERRKASS